MKDNYDQFKLLQSTKNKIFVNFSSIASKNLKKLTITDSQCFQIKQPFCQSFSLSLSIDILHDQFNVSFLLVICLSILLGDYLSSEQRKLSRLRQMFVC